MSTIKRRCPVEQIVERALEKKGVEFVTETDPRALRLDFFVPEFDLHIEVKQFHTPRIAEQMSRAANVIVIQGILAARAFDLLLNA